MKTSKPEGKGRKITPLGYVIGIGGTLLAVFSYIFLGIDRFFLGLRGVLGLSDIFWVFVGWIIWIFGIMAIVTLVMFMLGMDKFGKKY